jgi:putative phage-type endonuclease
MMMTTDAEKKSSIETLLAGLRETLNTIEDSLQSYKIVSDEEEQKSTSGWSKEDTESLFDSISVLVYDIITQNPLLYHEPNFHESIVEDVTVIMMDQMNDLLAFGDTTCNCIKRQFSIQTQSNDKQSNDKQSNNIGCMCSSNISDETYERKKREMRNLVENVMSIFYRYISPRRSYKKTFVMKQSLSKTRLEKISKKIEFLKGIPQAPQRTQEWYDARSKYLTASNIWKAFGTQSSQNQLIYEKCVKKNIEVLAQQNSYVSTESTLHWGQKYEPVSLMWYENEYSTKISDFGCIPHKSISFLAASPDGINTCIHSSRYGRMIEIKNIVNREINGIPKMEYWVQIQMQMEVCDLNECDFIETKFVEYDGEEYYKKTLSSEAAPSEAAPSEAPVATGVIMFFIKNEKPLYEYSKIDITPREFELWEAEMMEKHIGLTWNRNIYWKLEKVSCILILRNKLWFKSAHPVFNSIWDTIIKERETGAFLNRAPRKRSRQSPMVECKNEIVNLFADDIVNLFADDIVADHQNCEAMSSL